jgi:hypothetical protein
MFRQLANPPTRPTSPPVFSADALVTLRPSELTALLELGWNSRFNDPIKDLGTPDRRSNLGGLGNGMLNTLTQQTLSPAPPAVTPLLAKATDFAKLIPGNLFTPNPRQSTKWYWHHLIYAYMIENTRIYEIFRRVVHEYLHGEKLGVPSPNTQIWLRNTEELFYRDSPPFFITAVDSHIREDMRASRRNAYQRMFGMDLNHGKEDNTPYPYLKAEAANNDFVMTFEELLREVWIGIVNLNNSSGARAIDDAKIANLTSRLHDMLITRRISGNLSREEFAFVSMMSWFHLTVDSGNLPVILDLKAEAASPEEKLFKIAQRVGLPAHGLSKSYFDMAESISAVLIAIETGSLHATSVAASAFYDPGQPGPAITPTLPDTMKTIITHWTAITGRDVKAGKVASS